VDPVLARRQPERQARAGEPERAEHARRPRENSRFFSRNRLSRRLQEKGLAAEVPGRRRQRDCAEKKEEQANQVGLAGADLARVPELGHHAQGFQSLVGERERRSDHKEHDNRESVGQKSPDCGPDRRPRSPREIQKASGKTGHCRCPAESIAGTSRRPPRLAAARTVVVNESNNRAGGDKPRPYILERA
jgi:hypothetical protein